MQDIKKESIWLIILHSTLSHNSLLLLHHPPSPSPSLLSLPPSPPFSLLAPCPAKTREIVPRSGSSVSLPVSIDWNASRRRLALCGRIMLRFFSWSKLVSYVTCVNYCTNMFCVILFIVWCVEYAVVTCFIVPSKDPWFSRLIYSKIMIEFSSYTCTL